MQGVLVRAHGRRSVMQGVLVRAREKATPALPTLTPCPSPTIGRGEPNRPLSPKERAR